MSPFMSYIFSAGFSEIPPASKVIAFPTRPTTTSLFAAAGSWRSTISRGPFELARPTALSAPMPSSSISFGSIALTCSPWPPSSAARAARSAGVSSFGGELARSRAQLTHLPTRAVRLAVSATPFCSAAKRTIFSMGFLGCSSVFQRAGL